MALLLGMDVCVTQFINIDLNYTKENAAKLVS